MSTSVCWELTRDGLMELNEDRRAVDKPNIISKPTTVSEHFLTDHSASDMLLIPTQKLYSARDSKIRKAREAFLIKQEAH